MKVEELEKLAGSIGLLIKIQVRETIGLCFFRIVIAEQKDNIIKIWGEMKGWTYLNKKGIQCHFCINQFSDDDRKRFEERQKQIDRLKVENHKIYKE